MTAKGKKMTAGKIGIFVTTFITAVAMMICVSAPAADASSQHNGQCFWSGSSAGVVCNGSCASKRHKISVVKDQGRKTMKSVKVTMKKIKVNGKKVYRGSAKVKGLKPGTYFVVCDGHKPQKFVIKQY